MNKNVEKIAWLFVPKLLTFAYIVLLYDKTMVLWREISETENVHTGGFTAKQSYRKQAYKRRDRGNAVFLKHSS